MIMDRPVHSSKPDRMRCCILDPRTNTQNDILVSTLSEVKQKESIKNGSRLRCLVSQQIFDGMTWIEVIQFLRKESMLQY